MSSKKLSVALGIVVVLSMLLSACAAPTPQVVEKVVTQVVTQEKVVEKAGREDRREVVERSSRRRGAGRRAEGVAYPTSVPIPTSLIRRRAPSSTRSRTCA